MGRANVLHAAFNRGRVSPLAFGRDDLQGNRIRFGGEIQKNFIPRILGSGMFRPGWQYTGGQRNNAKAFHIPFIFNNSDTAILELTDQMLRVKVDETLVTRVAVSTALANSTFLNFVTNGTFAVGTGWTLGTGWTISGGVANATLSGAALSQTTPVALVTGKTYKLTMTITRTAGSLMPSVGGTNGTSRSAAGTYTENIIAGATQLLAFTGTGFSGTVDNVTIEPVDTNWTDADEGTAVSTLNGKLQLVGTAFAAAIRKQTVTVSGGDVGKEHALRVVVSQGPVNFRVGSTDEGDDYVAATTLGTGIHSLAFTPTGNFFIKFSSLRQYTVIVDSCAVEAAGTMEIASPWTAANLSLLRYEQSADVVYTGCKGYKQRKIERRATHSWSLVNYDVEDGPFRVENTGVTRIAPSAITGDVALTASRSLFRAEHVGALFQLTSIGQMVSADISGEDQWSDPIRVIGTSVQRSFDYAISGTWAGTVRIQRSIDEPGAWVDVTGLHFTANTASTYTDGLANQIIYYRIGIKTGEYTSGTASVSLSYSSGGITGVAKITGFTSQTVVSAIVLKTLGGTDSTSTWREGEWSDRRGYPMAPVLDQGRLWWAGKSKLFGSVSDAYESHDPTVVGDAGPINRSIPAGNVDDIQWLLSLERLIAGGPAAEFVVRSSTLDEPLTPTLFNVKSPSDRGSAAVAAVKLGSSGVFVGKSGTRLYEIKYSADGVVDYSTDNGDMCQICPEIGEPGIVRIAVQKNPDRRIHCLRSDGTVGIVIKDAAEDVLCWIDVDTDGLVEDLFVMPGAVEDKVYYSVKRTANGGDVRYLERWALESECQGGLLNKQADCFITYDGAPTATITGLGHLESRNVVVWGDAKDFSPLKTDLTPTTFTVTGGQITLPSTVSKAVVGLFYKGQFKGGKIAYAAEQGTALLQVKKVNQLGFILRQTHNRGLRYGRDFDHLDDLPRIGQQGQSVGADDIFANFDTDLLDFSGDWETDPRVCFEMSAPRPCTIIAMVMDVTTHLKG